MKLSVDEFCQLLAENRLGVRANRYGVAFFAPIALAGLANRMIGEEFNDRGDNYSVPVGRDLSPPDIRYLAGNYSLAPLNHSISLAKVSANLPGGVALFTDDRITASKQAKTIAIIQNGMVDTSHNAFENFDSFAEKFLGMTRHLEPTPKPLNLYETSLALSSLYMPSGADAPVQNGASILGIAWDSIFDELVKNPSSIFRFRENPRKFEEFIADSYARAGYKVILTPRSGDGGVDVIAEKPGFGAVKILDQSKAYAPDRVVSANDVRALMGTLSTNPSASKAVLTTTSNFAPGVETEFANFLPTRLELRNGENLLAWLRRVKAGRE